MPAERFADIRRIIEQELGAPTATIFSHIDPTPAGSASLGQVHRARLKDGRIVALKVQRPNIERIVRADLRSIRFVLERNVIWGDALSLMTVGENPKPIVFSEWSLVNGSMAKRRDFAFHELLSYHGTREQPLFSDLGEEVFFPEPVKEYPLTHYLKLADAEGE